MKLVPLGVAILALAAGPALAQTAFGDDGGCARVRGEAPQGDMVFILWPDRVERWESSCDIVATERLDAASVLLRTECSGEGETWEQRYVMAPLPDGAGFVIGPEEYPDVRFEVRLCQ